MGRNRYAAAGRRSCRAGWPKLSCAPRSSSHSHVVLQLAFSSDSCPSPALRQLLHCRPKGKGNWQLHSSSLQLQLPPAPHHRCWCCPSAHLINDCTATLHLITAVVLPHVSHRYSGTVRPFSGALVAWAPFCISSSSASQRLAGPVANCMLVLTAAVAGLLQTALRPMLHHPLQHWAATLRGVVHC
jgi:hypothetical protein